jgi:hypothetical protein
MIDTTLAILALIDIFMQHINANTHSLHLLLSSHSHRYILNTIVGIGIS